MDSTARHENTSVSRRGETCTDSTSFMGICPYCKGNSIFTVPSLAQTVGNMGKGLVNMALNPKRFFHSFYCDFAKLGRCSNCGEQVLRCPGCLSINPHEFDPMPCHSCGKSYGHP